MSNVRVLAHDQVVVMASAPSLIKRKRGARLIKKASLTAVLAWMGEWLVFWGLGTKVIMMG